MSINLSVDSLFNKVKDSSSNQSIIESDIEKKGILSENSILPEERLLCSPEESSHVYLVKGVVCHNNPITVLCPILAKGIICSRGTGPAMRRKPYRPKLLLKNHANPNLQLWSCKGCKDILLKINARAISLAL
ncbi:hypothetical protein JW887_02300 [Candidatus Dojkabacteria bacterium]|nr:hypothetical protein [Candidatus Dojkabacteria bacterium]